MSISTLKVLLDNRVMGILKRDSRSRITFQYSTEWLAADQPLPLSLSMPVLPTVYSPPVVENWLWGLLPDNADTLRRWGQQFHVSHRNVLALLTHVGEDVAGALQIVPEDWDAEVKRKQKTKWLTDNEFASRLLTLRTDAALTRRDEDPGRFSLAGAQAKTAMLFKNSRWAIPNGVTPTNRIIKLANEKYDGLVENEHFCLKLADAIGLNASKSHVVSYNDVTAIIVERYDRATIKKKIVRLHQEDMCQALGIHPEKRYQNESGPGVLELFDVLENSSDATRDRESFMRAQIFNFLIGGTDAHAKNFSILLDEGSEVRLAPLYDIASMLPYGDYKRINLSMRIGNSYRFSQTLPRHWEALGKRVRDVISPIEIFDDYLQRIPDATETVAKECAKDGLKHDIIGRLVESIKQMCERTEKNLKLFYKEQKKLQKKK